MMHGMMNRLTGEFGLTITMPFGIEQLQENLSQGTATGDEWWPHRQHFCSVMKKETIYRRTATLVDLLTVSLPFAWIVYRIRTYNILQSNPTSNPLDHTITTVTSCMLKGSIIHENFAFLNADVLKGGC